MKDLIHFEDFLKVDIRIGTIIDVQDFPEARNPSYKITLDFGPIGKRKTSAQVTELYSKENLIAKQVLAVINFPAKQIANFQSECLILGAVDGKKVFLLTPEIEVPNSSVIS